MFRHGALFFHAGDNRIQNIGSGCPREDAGRDGEAIKGEDGCSDKVSPKKRDSHPLAPFLGVALCCIVKPERFEGVCLRPMAFSLFPFCHCNNAFSRSRKSRIIFA